MTASEIKLEARLYALEWAVSQALFSIVLSSGVDPETQLEFAREQTIEGAREHTFPALGDPALSDLMSAEFEVAIDRLAAMQAALLKEMRRRQKRSKE